jgi:hypothetical protein
MMHETVEKQRPIFTSPSQAGAMLAVPRNKQIPEWLEKLGFAVHELEVSIEGLSPITYDLNIDNGKVAAPEAGLCQHADSLRHLERRIRECKRIIDTVQV